VVAPAVPPAAAPVSVPALLSGAEPAAPLWAGAAPLGGIIPAGAAPCVVAPAVAPGGWAVADVFAAVPVGAVDDAMAVVSSPQLPVALARGEAFS